MHTLSDGTTIKVKARRTIIGTQLHEVPSRRRRAGSLLWMDGGMYLLTGPDHKSLVRISHPDYAYAATEKDAKDKALMFFVECAEGSIKHATEEGIPVEQCY